MYLSLQFTLKLLVEIVTNNSYCGSTSIGSSQACTQCKGSFYWINNVMGCRDPVALVESVGVQQQAVGLST